MAGMRIGYAIAHRDIITGFNKIRNHFAVNRLAQVAALASVEDANVIPEILNKVEAGRERIYSFAKKSGLTYLPSATNFVSLDLQSSDRATTMLAQLNDNGVFIRMPGVAPLNRFIRVGIGTANEQAVFEEQFGQLL
jgi:histidinol-phosphate aminotransferase